MRNRTSERVVGSLLVALGFGVGATTLSIRPSQAQVLPTPRAFVSNFDLECFKAVTSVVTERQLTLSHLNPVLIAASVPSVAVSMGAVEQLCGAVKKNGIAPPTTVATFLQYTDLACHHVDPLQTTSAITLTLDQLNPAAAAIPSTRVTLNKLEQLCVPVMKNSLVAPAAIKRVIEQIDLACYQINLTSAVPQIPLTLTQLNPILAQYVSPTTIQTAAARQLCLPVAKNGNIPPSDVLNLIQWIDVEKFDIVSPTSITPFTLNLTHLNPVLLDLPQTTVTVSLPAQLALPVAKNGNIPPLQ
jgi:hypothetical protein